MYIIPKLISARNNATVQETDKAVIDVESQEDGVLAKIVVCSDLMFVFVLPCSRVHVIGSRRVEECRCW